MYYPLTIIYTTKPLLIPFPFLPNHFLSYLRGVKKVVLLFLLFLCHYFPAVYCQVNFEFRGVWIATVENIDWPSEKGLSVEEQKASFIKLLDIHQRDGINSVFVQVRPAADAFYPSPYEPWSEYLMGRQGLGPTPLYDPLAFMIEETHKRGMEFHAWINPYRAMFNIKHSSISPSHITKTHPEWFVTYGNTKYFNPGIPEVRAFVSKVVKDIVSRYDIDGIHMDDYFYPYRIEGKAFPDEHTYLKYGNGLDKDAWRRSNCDSIIKNIYEAITETNARVKFGISPFGVWRNKSKDIDGSRTTAGTTSYDDLFADILLWLKMGWIDYVAPQIYWECSHNQCPYNELLDWWSKHTYGKHLYIGHGIYKANINAAWKDKTELPSQIIALRAMKETQGSAFFSSQDLVRNTNGWADSLRENYYALPALVPPMSWIDSSLPSKPTITKAGSDTYTFNYKGEDKVKGFAIFQLAPSAPANVEHATLIKVLNGTASAVFNKGDISIQKDYRLFVATISINNNLSEWVELK